MLRCNFLAHFRSDYPIIYKINFVPNQHFDNVLICILINRVQPLFHVIKTSFISNIISDEYAISLFVETIRYRLKPILSSGVPDLHLVLVLRRWPIRRRNKVQSDRGHMRLRKLFLRIPTQSVKRPNLTFSRERSCPPPHRPK